MTRTLPFLATLALAACGSSDATAPVAAGPATPVAAPAGQQWTDVVTETPEGGHLMGNPNAPVTLTEFGSLTCNACASFSTTGTEPLMDYVRSGTVAFELRNFIRDGVDLVAAQLTHCVPDQAYFPVTESLFADQTTWFADRVDALNAQLAGLQDAPPARQSQAIAAATGLDSYFASRGLSAPAQAQCLSNTALATDLGERTQKAIDEFEVSGTPTFLINGRKIEGTTWQMVEPAIVKAGAVKG